MIARPSAPRRRRIGLTGPLRDAIFKLWPVVQQPPQSVELLISPACAPLASLLRLIPSVAAVAISAGRSRPGGPGEQWEWEHEVDLDLSYRGYPQAWVVNCIARQAGVRPAAPGEWGTMLAACLPPLNGGPGDGVFLGVGAGCRQLRRSLRDQVPSLRVVSYDPERDFLENAIVAAAARVRVVEPDFCMAGFTALGLASLVLMDRRMDGKRQRIFGCGMERFIDPRDACSAVVNEYRRLDDVRASTAGPRILFWQAPTLWRAPFGTPTRRRRAAPPLSVESGELPSIQEVERQAAEVAATDGRAWLTLALPIHRLEHVPAACIRDAIAEAERLDLDATTGFRGGFGIAVRARVWRRLDGLDPRYRTGFYALADLAFQIKQQSGAAALSRAALRRWRIAAESLDFAAARADAAHYEAKWAGPIGGECSGIPWQLAQLRRCECLSILTCFNERRFLPWQVAYLQSEGIQPLIIDNFSDDGSWEWIQAHGVPGIRLDTGGAFDLRLLQRERLRLQRALEPQWVVYGDMDEFNVSPDGLRALLKRADALSVQMIRLPRYTFFRTSEREENPANPLEACRFGREQYRAVGGIVRLHRFEPRLRYHADGVILPGARSLRAVTAANLNYGETKGPKLRYPVLLRRRAAWARGFDRALGGHYESGRKHDWVWNPDELQDFQGTDVEKLAGALARRLGGFVPHSAFFQGLARMAGPPLPPL